LKEDHEKPTDDGFLETVYIPGKDAVSLNETLSHYHLIDRYCFIHPDQYKKDKTNAWLLKIVPKLGIYEHPRVFNFTKI
jgi:hypothetical protein